eukprot:scaffold27429_cov90-Isochrysis_galbana.AAC.3
MVQPFERPKYVPRLQDRRTGQIDASSLSSLVGMAASPGLARRFPPQRRTTVSRAGTSPPRCNPARTRRRRAGCATAGRPRRT